MGCLRMRTLGFHLVMFTTMFAGTSGEVRWSDFDFSIQLVLELNVDFSFLLLFRFSAASLINLNYPLFYKHADDYELSDNCLAYIYHHYIKKVFGEY